MDYPFPGIAGACPVCRGACGAIYRGYYRRWAVVPDACFVGWVAIRTAVCRRDGVRFAMFPSFLITYRSFSRQAMSWLVRAWRRSSSGMTEETDRWFRLLQREVYLSISTLYAQLRFVLRELRLGERRMGLPELRGASLSELLAIEPALIESAISHSAFGLGASSRIDPPP